MLVAGGLLAGSVAYVDHRDDAIDRVDVGTPPESLDGAVNILVAGTDARPAGDPSGVTGIRADTILLVRIEPSGRVRLLSLPRDLLVPATGDRLSEAASEDGPEGLVDAVTSLTGVPVDHYVQVDFDGLVGMVESLGGVEVAVDRPLRDPSTGLDLPADRVHDARRPDHARPAALPPRRGRPVRRPRTRRPATVGARRRRRPGASTPLQPPDVDRARPPGGRLPDRRCRPDRGTMVDLAWSCSAPTPATSTPGPSPWRRHRRTPTGSCWTPARPRSSRSSGARRRPGSTDATAGTSAPEAPNQPDLAAIGNGGIGPCAGS